jgi:release factor glutamine methyltransferase
MSFDAIMQHADARMVQTFGDLLADAAQRVTREGVADPGRTAELIGVHVIGLSREQVFADLGRPPTAEECHRLRSLVEDVEAGQPTAYRIGYGSFLGRDFEITRDTLIPRRDTEELVRIVLNQVHRNDLPRLPRILEPGSGCGCVAITIALELPRAGLIATDVSPAALDVAIRNARRHGVDNRIRFVQGNLLAPFGDCEVNRSFDLIVSNPPYARSGQITETDRPSADREPRVALDGGSDGLEFHRRIIGDCHRHLVPGGWIYLEHEADQGLPARRIAGAHKELDSVRTLKDARGRDRVLAARRRLR